MLSHLNLDLVALGCQRSQRGEARVKSCEPMQNWQKLVHLSYGEDERVGAQLTPVTPFHIEL